MMVELFYQDTKEFAESKYKSGSGAGSLLTSSLYLHPDFVSVSCEFLKQVQDDELFLFFLPYI